VAGHLYVDVISKEPIAKEKNADHQDAMGLIHFQVVPENVGIRGGQFPFEKGSHRVINSIPEAQKKVSPLPNPWYIVNEIQA
jgi:hypothetical protein